MQPNTDNDKLVIAISSRALFNLDASHQIYEREGLDAYQAYQIKHEDEPLEPGHAFALVKKLLALNELADRRQRVDIILLSRNSADTGLRVFNSIEHYQLGISRAAFCSGDSPYRYVQAFGAQLFLSSHAEDVRKALDAGMAAATLLASSKSASETEQLRIAFDGDAVIFSDEAERVYKTEGLQAFTESEKASARTSLRSGPFKSFLAALHSLQTEFSAEHCPIRTALITARSAPAHERVIRTLREWKIRIDESLFLGGLPKGPFLQAFQADVFFDDQTDHCNSAKEFVATGHVPHGIANQPKAPVMKKNQAVAPT